MIGWSYLPDLNIRDDAARDFAKLDAVRPVRLILLVPPLGVAVSEWASSTDRTTSTYGLAMPVDPTPARIDRPSKCHVRASREGNPRDYIRYLRRRYGRADVPCSCIVLCRPNVMTLRTKPSTLKTHIRCNSICALSLTPLCLKSQLRELTLHCGNVVGIRNISLDAHLHVREVLERHRREQVVNYSLLEENRRIRREVCDGRNKAGCIICVSARVRDCNRRPRAGLQSLNSSEEQKGKVL